MVTLRLSRSSALSCWLDVQFGAHFVMSSPVMSMPWPTPADACDAEPVSVVGPARLPWHENTHVSPGSRILSLLGSPLVNETGVTLHIPRGVPDVVITLVRTPAVGGVSV